MSVSEKFCLKWDDFRENVSTSFKDLRKDLDVDFADITLACEDKQFELHKVVLASGCNFFRNILKKYKSTKPLIYMRGLKAKELEAVVDFLYNGQVNIFEEDLNNFLNLAREMEIKGLETVNSEESKQLNCKTPKVYNSIQIKTSSTISHVKDRFSPNEVKHDNEIETESFNVSTPHILAKQYTSTNMIGNIDNIENYEETVNSMMERTDGIWTCIVCGKNTKSNSRGHLKDHVETHIDGITHLCKICGKTYKSNHALKNHYYSHKQL